MKWLLALLLLAGPALAHDDDHEHDQWYSELRQPDNPTHSCCGIGDSYWCDAIHVRDGKTFCTITDTRSNTELKRTPVAVGTVIEIPDKKLGAYKGGNPTGHAIVFLSSGHDPVVYCFVQGHGI